MRPALSVKIMVQLFFPLVFLNCNLSAEKKSIPVLHTVEIKGMKFTPDVLTVKKGDTVVWINRDIVAHDVTEQSTNAWSSSLMPTGKSWYMVLEKTTDYYCSIHQVMKGKLVVE